MIFLFYFFFPRLYFFAKSILSPELAPRQEQGAVTAFFLKTVIRLIVFF